MSDKTTIKFNFGCLGCFVYIILCLLALVAIKSLWTVLWR